MKPTLQDRGGSVRLHLATGNSSTTAATARANSAHLASPMMPLRSGMLQRRPSSRSRSTAPVAQPVNGHMSGRSRQASAHAHTNDRQAPLKHSGMCMQQTAQSLQRSQPPLTWAPTMGSLGVLRTPWILNCTLPALGGVGTAFTLTVACTQMPSAAPHAPTTPPGGPSSWVTGPSLQQQGGARRSGVSRRGMAYSRYTCPFVNHCKHCMRCGRHSHYIAKQQPGCRARVCAAAALPHEILQLGLNWRPHNAGGAACSSGT